MFVQPLGQVPTIPDQVAKPAAALKGLSNAKLEDTTTTTDGGAASAPPVDQVELSDVARKLSVPEPLAGGDSNAELQLSPSNLRKLAKGQAP